MVHEMDDKVPVGNRRVAGASIVVLRKDSVLLVERSREPSKGLWSFPAGRAEPGETPEENARRELREETGLIVGRVVELGLFHPPPADSPFRITVFGAHAGEGEPVAADDAKQAEFVPLVRVLERPLTPGAPGWIARAIAALSDSPLPTGLSDALPLGHVLALERT
jgi:ADP-ribose pyrophosphatase YjhB (NUDIX family)